MIFYGVKCLIFFHNAIFSDFYDIKIFIIFFYKVIFSDFYDIKFLIFFS